MKDKMEEQQAEVVFRIENIVIKNLSLETPENVVTPTFKEDPVIKLELRNSSRPLSRDHYYEVVLETTMRAQSGDEVQLLVEVSQAGIFYLQNADAQQRETLLNVHAPELLYPYMSQLTSDLMMRAGAPRIFLPPFNFRALHEKKREALEKHLAEDNDKPEAS